MDQGMSVNDFLGSRDYLRIFQFHSRESERLICRESTWLELKESFDWGKKAKYAKTIAAFANRQGGYLLFGIANNPRVIRGISEKKFEDFDESRITEYLNKYFSPEIRYQKFTIELQGKSVGILRVEPSNNRPIVCLGNDQELREGEIYYRYGARSECIKYPEIRAILDYIRRAEGEMWMKHFEKISRLGAGNVALLDLENGELSGKSGSLLIDEKLLKKIKFIKQGSFREGGEPVLRIVGDALPTPVFGVSAEAFQITDDPGAPSVKIEEEELLARHFPLDYGKVIQKLNENIQDFRQTKKFHTVRQSLMKDKTLYRERFLDPGNPKSAKKGFYSPMIIKRLIELHEKRELC